MVGFSSTVNGTMDLIINGVTGYQGDEGKGITAHNFGHGGFTVAKWMENPAGRPNWLDDILGEGLDLLVVGELGVNDANVFGTGPLTAEEFRTAYSDLLDYIRSFGYTGPIVCVGAMDL